MPRARYRRVRTPEGAERYGVPIGSIIRVNPSTGELHRGSGRTSAHERRRTLDTDDPKAPAAPKDHDDEDDGTDDVDPEDALDELLDKSDGVIAPEASPAAEVGPPKGTVPDPADIRSASNGERGDEEVRAALAENIAGRYDTGIEVRVESVQLERNDFDEVESVWANLHMHDDTGQKVAHTSLNFRVDDEGMALTGGPQGGMDNYFFMNLENPRQEFDVQDTIGQIVQATREWPEPAPDRSPIGETDVPDYLGSPSEESELYRERRAAIDAGDADEVAEIEDIIRDLDEASGERFRAELVYENQRSLERALKRKDIDADEAIEMARDGLAQFLEGRQVAVNVPSRNFGAILDAGRLLSQRDDGALTGVGTHAPDDRARIETAWFGEHEHPPIYGYIRDPGGAPSGADTYGRIALILNDDVRNRRTSVNVGDSLAGSESIFPGPLNDPGEFSGNPALAARLGHRTPEDYAAWLAEGTDDDDDEGFYQRVYVEAQIHSGLSLSEVQQVVFRDHADADRYGPRLRELDIPFTVVPDRESPDAPAFSEDELAALRAFGASVPDGMTRAEYERLRAESEAE
ncbi:hypothetical protein [Rhodococcus rhodochrous]|uniref:hypothetical protein n=1 Tax=Rhodococcus rhodochrous TaxID=1829 RepID=UPI00178673F5|nr:hypothetical protein [Rhodococcus rhodochrous]QOH59897.1 hypothetical protein C6Y44_27800 [Rhodococcus rhodochrous]